MTDVPITHSMGAVVLSEKQYRKLTPSQAETVQHIAEEIFARLGNATREQNAEAAEAILERNLRLAEPDPRALIDFEAIGHRVWERLVGELYERELLDQLTAALEAAR